MSTNFQNQDSPFSANGRFGRLSYLGWSMSLILFLLLLGIFANIFLPLLINIFPTLKATINFAYFILIYIIMIFLVLSLQFVDDMTKN